MPSSQTWLNLSYTPPSTPTLVFTTTSFSVCFKTESQKNECHHGNKSSFVENGSLSVCFKTESQINNAILEINPLHWKWWLTYWQSPLQQAMNESGPRQPLNSSILLFDQETMVISAVAIPKLGSWHRYLAEIFSTSQWCMCTIYICWVLLWFNTGY